jgi:uncharacterized protein (TIGR02217 family)
MFLNFPDPTPIFPTLFPLTWSVHKTPSFTSTSTVAISGRETQLIRALYPRWEFVLSYSGDSWLRDETQNITPDGSLSGFLELQDISGLFTACLGSYGEFYYSDPDDNSRAGVGLGDGNGTTTTFPIIYTWGTGPFMPQFYAPVGGIQSIQAVYLNGVPQSASTYGVDSTNTMLVFTTPPGLGVAITIDFTFYFRCRFLEDMSNYSQWARNLWENKDVKFKSVKQ